MWWIHSEPEKPEHITAPQTYKILRKKRENKKKKLTIPTWGCSFARQQKIARELQRSFETRGLEEQEEFWINQDRTV